MNGKGYTAWISLNTKEIKIDKIEGISHLDDLWFDLDARPKEVKDRVATKEELGACLKQTERLYNYIKETYGADGFIAYSGNGFHLHYPLSHIPLFGRAFRKEVNEKVNRFVKQITDKAGVEVDHTSDLRRVTTIIGSYNLKIADEPLLTKWDKSSKVSKERIEEIRGQNTGLVEAIFNTNTDAGTKGKEDASDGEGIDDDFKDRVSNLLKNNKKFSDLMEGKWESYGYESRSEAEQAVLTILVREGFNNVEILKVMIRCKIGKWQESKESYKKYSIGKAREYTKDEGAGNSKKSQRDTITKQITHEVSANSRLFHDQFFDPYAAININGHTEIYPIDSKAFKRWISRIVYKKIGTAPTDMAIRSALLILEGVACFDGDMIELHNRVAEYGDAIFYDMSNLEWQAIRIDAEGWKIVDNPPILFRRYSHQKTQTKPAMNGDAKELLKYLGFEDLDDQLLFLVLTISYFIPNIPHPIMCIHGDHGGGKSTCMAMVKSIIDPSEITRLSMPRDEENLVQALYHHYFSPIDNLTILPFWASDSICRAITGEGHQKRRLYTDQDDVIFVFRSCVGTNGINIAMRTPDILDRTIFFELPRIRSFKSDREIWDEFGLGLPVILGGIFDILSKAIGIKSELDGIGDGGDDNNIEGYDGCDDICDDITIHNDAYRNEKKEEEDSKEDLNHSAQFSKSHNDINDIFHTPIFQAKKEGYKIPSNVRLADFCIWGEAIARALGYGDNVFTQALLRKTKAKNFVAIEGSPVGSTIVELMKNRDEWSGTPSELYGEIESVAKDMKMNTKAKEWPKAPNALSRRLREIKTNLDEVGIKVDMFQNSGKRTIRVCKISSLSSYRHKSEQNTLDGEKNKERNGIPDNDIAISSGIPSSQNHEKEIEGEETIHLLITKNQRVIEDYLDADLAAEQSSENDGIYYVFKDRRTEIQVSLMVFMHRLRSKDVERLISLSSTSGGESRIFTLCWRIRPEDNDLLSSRGIRVIMLDDLLPHLRLDFLKAPVREYFGEMLGEEKRPSYLGACLVPSFMDTPKEMIRKVLQEMIEDGEIEIVGEIAGGMDEIGGNTYFGVVD